MTVGPIARLTAIAALLSIAAGLAIGALGSASLNHEVAENGIPCVFRLLTGVVCPLCGLTHATLSLGQGDIAGAFAAHPIAPFVLFVICWTAWMLMRGRAVRIAGRPLRPLAALAGIAVVWAVNLAAHAA